MNPLDLRSHLKINTYRYTNALRLYRSRNWDVNVKRLERLKEAEQELYQHKMRQSGIARKNEGRAAAMKK